ncbi:MAG: OmpA family protein [Proteobacteria bacterium]|nr:OmpA family protein [Pseudomonadota bacterium]
MDRVSKRRTLARCAVVGGIAWTLGAGTACVSQSKFDGLAAEREALSRSEAKLRAQVEELEGQRDQLNTRLQERDEELGTLKGTYDALVGELRAELASGQIEIEQLRNGLRLNVSDEVLFPSGSALLDDGGRAVLKKVSRELAKVSHRVEVEGHTDDVPIRGRLAERYPTNWELAGARASQVARLLESEGVNSERLVALSYGPNQPVAPNDSEVGRAKNRRIEIRLIPEELSSPAVSSAPTP